MIIVNYIFNNGELVLETFEDKRTIQLFKLQLKEGDKIECFFDIKKEANKSLAQLKKVHVMIRKLSEETGDTFEKLKKDLKYNNGLYTIVNDNIEYKSLKDCTKEEIEKLILNLYDINNKMGFQLF